MPLTIQDSNNNGDVCEVRSAIWTFVLAKHQLICQLVSTCKSVTFFNCPTYHSLLLPHMTIIHSDGTSMVKMFIIWKKRPAPFQNWLNDNGVFVESDIHQTVKFKSEVESEYTWVQFRPQRWSIFQSDGMVNVFFQATIEFNGFSMVLTTLDHHHWMFFEGPTIGINGFSMVFKILRAMVNDGLDVPLNLKSAFRINLRQNTNFLHTT